MEDDIRYIGEHDRVSKVTISSLSCWLIKDSYFYFYFQCVAVPAMPARTTFGNIQPLVGETMRLQLEHKI